VNDGDREGDTAGAGIKMRNGRAGLITRPFLVNAPQSSRGVSPVGRRRGRAASSAHPLCPVWGDGTRASAVLHVVTERTTVCHPTVKQASKWHRGPSGR
jgi:hypothetical protein